MTIVLYLLASIGLGVSFFKSKEKTKIALKKALKSFENMLPQLSAILVIIGIAAITLITERSLNPKEKDDIFERALLEQ